MPQAAAFVRQIDKLPLPVKSAPGFLVNRVLAPYLGAAMRCLDEGIAPETIDEAALAFGMPMGPIELADTVGLDICAAVGRMLAPDAPPPPRRLAGSSQPGISGARRAAASTTTRPAGRSRSRPDAIPRDSPTADRTVCRRSEGGAGGRHRRGRRSGRRRRDLRHGFAPFTGGPLHYAAAARRVGVIPLSQVDVSRLAGQDRVAVRPRNSTRIAHDGAR